MKTFTKVMLALAGIFATAGVVCIIIAFIMGFSTNDLAQMVKDGNFSIQIEDGELKVFGLNDSLILEIEDAFEKNENSYFDEDGDVKDSISSTETENGTTIYEIEEACTSLDIEFAAGIFEIYYTDVENIVVEGTDVDELFVQVRNNTLEIGAIAEVNVDIDGVEDRKLVVKIPTETQFKSVDMEIGASQADIRDLNTEELEIAVGAGQANVDQVSVSKLDVEVGVGEVNIALNDVQEDYNYNIECGIGSVTVGTVSYGGFAAEKRVTNPGAAKEINVECGMGEVTIQFKNII